MGIEIVRLTASEPGVIGAGLDSISSQPRSDISTVAGLHPRLRECARCGSHGCVRLRPDWPSLLSILPRLGPVRCVTSNRYARLQVDGCYPEYQHFGCRGLFTADMFDLRFCQPALNAAFAVVSRRMDQGVLSRGIHFHDRSNTEVHSALLSANSSVGAFEDLLEEFVDPSPSTKNTVGQACSFTETTPISAAHKDMLLCEWEKLKDTLSFGALLRSYGVSRGYAFALAQGRFTRFVEPKLIRWLLGEILERTLFVNVRVGNSASEQVYRGVMQTLDCFSGTLALRDRHACVRIEEKYIASAWIVTHPTKAGRIESLEFHASDGEVILTICGVRTQAGPQEHAWYQFLSDIPNSRIDPDLIRCTNTRH